MHYCQHGIAEGRDNGMHPSDKIFNERIYLILYEDIRSIMPSWIHYAKFGKKEGRHNGVLTKLLNDIYASAE